MSISVRQKTKEEAAPLRLTFGERIVDMAKDYIERYRDAGTGKYVTEKYAEKHPKTTVKERDKK